MSSGYQMESLADLARRHAVVEELRANQRHLDAARQEVGDVGQAQGSTREFIPGIAKLYDPQKMFTRAEVLAVLRGHLALATARPPEMNERDALRALITVFERME